jgi:hypothetical protein
VRKGMVARGPSELPRRLHTVAGNRTVGYSGAQPVVLDGSGVGVMVVGGFAEDCMIPPPTGVLDRLLGSLP